MTNPTLGRSTVACDGKAQVHPEVRDRTIWEMFEAERASPITYARRLDGFHAIPATSEDVPGSLRHKQLLRVGQRGRPVEIHAYADRVELR